MSRQWERIKVASFSELLEHEQEIVRRIAETPNGGNLFMIHPLMCLSDVGVDLTEGAVAEIKQREPHLSGLSATPYNALKASREEQNIIFHVHGLFRREPE